MDVSRETREGRMAAFEALRAVDEEMEAREVTCQRCGCRVLYHPQWGWYHAEPNRERSTDCYRPILPGVAF